MNASVVINAKNEIAFIYGEPLGIEPAWTTFDVEMKQLNIFNEESEERFLRLDEVQQKIYERIEKAAQILLIQVKDNNITTPVKVDKVPLMVATQYSN